MKLERDGEKPCNEYMADHQEHLKEAMEIHLQSRNLEFQPLITTGMERQKDLEFQCYQPAVDLTNYSYYHISEFIYIYIHIHVSIYIYMYRTNIYS